MTRRFSSPPIGAGVPSSRFNVKLQGPEAFEEFKDALTTDPRLAIQAQREPDYYSAQSTMLVTLVNVLGRLVAGLMGIGAVFGALNTMYTAVAARTREIATLRALGFGGGPVVISVMAEAFLLGPGGRGVRERRSLPGFRRVPDRYHELAELQPVGLCLPMSRRLYWWRESSTLPWWDLWEVSFPAIRAARLPVASALREL